MKLKILIVEDYLLLAEAVSDFFEGKGWEAEQVHDGMTAVEKTEAGSYQMILLDVMLPEMNGFEVCRKIRQNSDIPIFLLPPGYWKKTNWPGMRRERTIILQSLFRFRRCMRRLWP